MTYWAEGLETAQQREPLGVDVAAIREGRCWRLSRLQAVDSAFQKLAPCDDDRSGVEPLPEQFRIERALEPWLGPVTLPPTGRERRILVAEESDGGRHHST